MDDTVRRPRPFALLSVVAVAAAGGCLVRSLVHRCDWSTAGATEQSDAEHAEHAEPIDTVAAVVQSEAEFLARIKHDLRTPLNAILGFSQLLEMDELTPDQSESVAEIIKGGHQLLDLINGAGIAPAPLSHRAG